MLNEYLFLSDENRAAVEGYKPPADVKFKISEVNETSWIASFSINGDDQTSAMKLSEVHSEISEFSPLVLMCESSGYYNKELYPLVNELERKLRNLLYSVLPFSKHEKARENIKDLESMSLFWLFNVLFIDKNFNKEIRNWVTAAKNSKYYGLGPFTKSEIQNRVNTVHEKTFWDDYLGKEYAPTLRERFREVNAYRNQVMHAHNMDSDEFHDAKDLFSTINEELDDAIEKFARSKDKKVVGRKKHAGAALAAALDSMRVADMLTFKIPSNIPVVYDEIAKQTLAVERLNDIVSKAANTPASRMAQELATQDFLSKIARNLEIIQPYKIAEELAQRMLSATNFDYLISPGLQRSLDNFQAMEERLNLLSQAARLPYYTFPSDDDNEINELLDESEEDDPTEPS